MLTQRLRRRFVKEKDPCAHQGLVRYRSAWHGSPRAHLIDVPARATASIGCNATIADACDRCNARKVAQAADAMRIAALRSGDAAGQIPPPTASQPSTPFFKGGKRLEATCSKSRLFPVFSGCIADTLMLLVRRASSRTATDASKDDETSSGFGLECTKKRAVSGGCRDATHSRGRFGAIASFYMEAKTNVPIEQEPVSGRQ